MTRILLAALLACVGSGCTHLQLKRSTIRQAETLEDIYQQQVLDNLAKFVQNPNALPHFAFPNQGSASVEDTGATNPAASWGPPAFTFADASIGAAVGRNVKLGWTMDPIRDPHKLALMQCAYQRAIAGSVTGPIAACSNCDARFADFYGGQSAGHGSPSEAAAALMFRPGWFRYGCLKDIPKDCCAPVGHNCGVCVWVPPEGRDELTKLTLAILDFAFHDPKAPTVANKTVKVYLDSANKPTTSDKAVTEISALVPAAQDLSEAARTLVADKKDKAAPPPPQLPVTLPGRGAFGADRASLLPLQQQLEMLDTRGGR